MKVVLHDMTKFVIMVCEINLEILVRIFGVIWVIDTYLLCICCEFV